MGMLGKKHSEETKHNWSLKRKGVKLSVDHIEKIRTRMIGNKFNLGKKASKETKEKMSVASKGKPHSEQHNMNVSLSLKGKPSPLRGTTQSPELRRKRALIMMGEKSHFWKGGITPINQKIRSSIEYKLWREAVFKRDNFTCVWCLKKGGELNADHIKSFLNFPELRFALDNGRTLCVPCHKTTNNYAGRVHKNYDI